MEGQEFVAEQQNEKYAALQEKTEPDEVVTTQKPEKEKSKAHVWWYIVGVLFFIIMAIILSVGSFNNMKMKYVGGDAYNYIIAGTRATAHAVRALIFAVLGSVSFLMGKRTK